MSELNNESGGHRIQRIPPTERRGRVHSSTVTVAVTDPSRPQRTTFNERDFRIEWYSGTGCGGQNRNKVQSSCRITHIPTGLIRTAQTRSRENSLRLAKESLEEAVEKQNLQLHNERLNSSRADQVGSGMRGDKIRTYRFQDDVAVDHRTNRKASTKLVISEGRFDLLR